MKKIQLLWQCFSYWKDRETKIITVKIGTKKFWFELCKYEENKYTKSSQEDFVYARELIKKAFDKYNIMSDDIKKRKKVYELNYFL